MAEFTLRIDGMHCGSCVRRVSQTLGSLNTLRVKEVRLGAARIESDDAPDAASLAIEALAKAGYQAQVEQ